jgi:hypothetical protein
MPEQNDKIQLLQQELSKMRSSMETALANKNQTLIDEIITKSITSNTKPATPENFYNDVEKHAIDLEADHPKAALIVREIMSTLHSLGI